MELHSYALLVHAPMACGISTASISPTFGVHIALYM